jgi:hypothetical protein
MTNTASGTPLILSFLALGISFLSAVGSIAAVLMARANLQRQLQVTVRQTWMRDFREQVAQFMAWHRALKLRQMHHGSLPPGDREKNARQTEIQDGMLHTFHAIYLLIAERDEDEQHTAFVQSLLEFVNPPNEQEEEARAQAIVGGAAAILRRERGTIEAPGRWWRARLRSGFGVVRPQRSRR